MITHLDENRLESVVVDDFRELGYKYVHGPSVAPDLPDRQAGGDAPERADYSQVVLLGRLRDARIAMEKPRVSDERSDFPMNGQSLSLPRQSLEFRRAVGLLNTMDGMGAVR